MRAFLRQSGTRPLLAAGTALAFGLVLVVWLDSRATRTELLALLRDQAAALRQTIAAAARSNWQAGQEVEAQLTARLLDNARLLAELDRRGALDEELLDQIARRHGLFRVTAYAADGTPELASGSEGRPRLGRGPGGPGGPGHLIAKLIDAEQPEATTEVHRSRWGEARAAAGVRRVNGGAIVLNVDARAAEALERQASLDALLGDIAAGAAAVAYVVFEQGSVRVAHGDLPQDNDGDDPAAPDAGEREREVSGGPVLELAGPVVLGEGAIARLRLGMRLDGVRAAERRMLWKLGLSLGASLALGSAGVGALWLRRKYGLLSEEHARAEAALRRRDRLVAMGELASGVAHEVRNPLNAIAMSVKRLRTELPPEALADPERIELLDVLEGETRRIDATVQQFLEYARPRPPEPRQTDIARLVREIGEATQALAASRGVSLEVDAAVVVEATVDADQLRQAVDNLLRNAIEATPPEGRVALRARQRAGAVEIEVRDTGHGIDPEDLPQIFDLYFTTKPSGTGVGLAVTHQIVTAHDGNLGVESQPGRGTSISISLPIRSTGFET